MHERDARDLVSKYRADARAGKEPEELARRGRGRLGNEDNDGSMMYLKSQWIEDAKTHERTWEADEAAIKKHILPNLGEHTPVAAVKYEHVARMHRRITESGSPIAANRVLSLCAAMFQLAENLELRPRNSNPCTDVRKNPENKRRIYLSRKGAEALLDAVELYPDGRVANAIKFLLYTGARRHEVLAATYDEFVTQEETGVIVWHKLSAHTKTKIAHEVPLNPAAHELLVSMRAVAASRYLFPGDKPNTHLVDIKKGWRSICKKAGLEGFHLHDIRHSHASALISRGVPLAAVGALLGHTQPRTTMRYAHIDPTALLAASAKLVEFLPDKAKWTPV
jgi:integrase